MERPYASGTAVANMLCMEKQPRVTFEIPEHIRRAIGMIASREGVTIGEALALCVEAAEPDTVKIALEAAEAGKPTVTRRGPIPKKPKA